jgi:ubiquinone/menaquinone biosynthesis C-methylase UbiE
MNKPLRTSDHSTPGAAFDSAPLYDELAPDYDAGYAAATFQRAYDQLAWSRVIALLPPRPCTIIDAGCGTGRWAELLVQAGHRVIGIEQSAEMIRQTRSREMGEAFSLMAGNMESVDLAEAAADAVLAMGSLQYTADPVAQLARFAAWVRPGGHVAVYVDSLVALVLELLRRGKTEEALLRLRTRVGDWRTHGLSAQVHLFDDQSLRAAFTAAGLVGVQAYGLLCSASATGSAACTQRMQQDEAGFLACEQQLADSPLLVDVGKHILMLGQRPQ